MSKSKIVKSFIFKPKAKNHLEINLVKIETGKPKKHFFKNIKLPKFVIGILLSILFKTIKKKFAKKTA